MAVEKKHISTQGLNIFWKKLKSRFKSKPIPFSDVKEYTIVPAFALDGIQYYEVVGLFNIPYQRGLSAADIFEEVNMRVTREYLQLHTDAIKTFLSDAKSINVLEISKLINELDQRVSWIVSPETLYKLASVVYFDENESPLEYNYEYAIEKIKKWKKHKLSDFFLQKPIGKYIPHTELQGDALLSYMETAMQVERKQLENLLHLTSKVSSTKEYYKASMSFLEEVS